MNKSAILSECNRYRYTLSRTWDADRDALLFVMLNPSTADAELDDPTIRRCIGFGESLGYGSVTVVNLFAFRATDPKQLYSKEEEYLIGPKNDFYIRFAANESDTVVCAWGSHGRRFPKRVARVAKLIGQPLWCLRQGRDGTPHHPLYLPGDLQLQTWELP